MHRTPAERDAKWSHLAEVAHGQLYVVVLGNRQQSDLMAELSAWIRTSQTMRDVPYDESLQKILTQLRLPDRIMDGDDRKSVQRVSTYVIVRTLMRLGG